MLLEDLMNMRTNIANIVRSLEECLSFIIFYNQYA